MGINEKAAYIKGMIDGMDLDKNDKTVRVLNAVVITESWRWKVRDLNDPTTVNTPEPTKIQNLADCSIN